MFLATYFGTAMAMLPTIANAMAPQPTDPPSAAAVLARFQRLNKRASESDTSTLVWTVATDKTCGYVSGDIDSAITCENSKLTCMWYIATGTNTYGAMACSIPDSTETTDYTANWYCVDSTAFQSTTDYTESQLLCTESSAPYCQTFAYPNRVTDFRCTDKSQTEATKIFWTYDGQDVDEAGFIYRTELTNGELYTPETTATDMTSDTASSTEVETTAASTSSAGSSSSSTPVGPIVGGVVGGLAVLAFIVLGALYLLRQTKAPQKAEDGAQEAADQPLQSQSPAGMPEAKPFLATPATPSPAGAYGQPHWGVSPAMTPQPVSTPAPMEMDSTPPVFLVHELPGNHHTA